MLREIIGMDELEQVSLDSVDQDSTSLFEEPELEEVVADDSEDEVDEEGKEPKEEEVPDDAEYLDDDEDEDEEKALDDSKSTNKDGEEALTIDSITAKALGNDVYTKAQKELGEIANSFNDLGTDLVKPVKPEVDEYGSTDEEEMAQYRTDMSLYKSKIADRETSSEKSQDKMRKLALTAQKAFADDFKGVDLTPFSDWLAEDQPKFLAWTMGSMSLYELYSVYLSREGRLQDSASAKKLKKNKVKIKKRPTLDMKGSHTANSSSYGGNGFNTKFKYANSPKMKQLVKMYKGQSSNVTGKKYTSKDIDDICKSELTYNKDAYRKQ